MQPEIKWRLFDCKDFARHWSGLLCGDNMIVPQANCVSLCHFESTEIHKVKGHECKIKEGDVVIIHDDKISRVLWLVVKVEKVLQSKDNKARGATIKYVTTGKTVVICRSINKLYPFEPMKQTNAGVQTKFVDDTKICQIETPWDTLSLICYTV